MKHDSVNNYKQQQQKKKLQVEINKLKYQQKGDEEPQKLKEHTKPKAYYHRQIQKTLSLVTNTSHQDRFNYFNQLVQTKHDNVINLNKE